MEEDIMILESECYYLEELGYLRENNHFIRFNQALGNLIKGYRELEREKEMHKNNSNKLYKDYNKLTDEFDLLNKENNRNKETIKRYRKYLNKKDKRFKETLENEYQERETDYIPKSKIKEKIKEYKKKIEEKPYDKPIIEIYIRVLQELMEDK